MADLPTAEGIGRAMVILALLWWSWGGYAWLTSVVDPEEGEVRIAIFAAMAAFLIVALCVPEAFGGLALEFAVAYTGVRAAHLALFVIASTEDPDLRHSVFTLAVSTAIAGALLIAGSFLDTGPQLAVWSFALALDLIGPYFFGVEGWKLNPRHFAERYGLIIIIALGESIVAIGIGAEAGLTWGIAAAAALGVALAATLWWAYFDVVSHVNVRRLVRAPVGRVQNAFARDGYSYLHFPMVAGIVLVALGLKKTLEHVDDPLKTVPAFALLGGVAIYLLAHVAFRWRGVHTLNRQRTALALLLFALVPVATEVSALIALVAVVALMSVLITYETIHYGESRYQVRHEDD
jgi:low temperature requirement protein LtrA